MNIDVLKTKLSKEWLLGNKSFQAGFNKLAEIFLNEVWRQHHTMWRLHRYD